MLADSSKEYSDITKDNINNGDDDDDENQQKGDIQYSAVKMRPEFANFMSWTEARGIQTPLQLVTQDDTSYRYMSLPDDEKMLGSLSKVPGQTTIVQVPLETCLRGENWETLVDKLKFEKNLGIKSDFAPWLDLFPTLEDFQDMPRFWKSERLSFVSRYDGGQLETRMNIDQLRFDAVDDPWALACVDSRSNFLPDNTYSITPLLDMFNHRSGVQTTARVDGASRLLLDVDTESIYQSTEKQNDSSSADWKDQIFGGLFGGNGGGAGGGSSVYRPGKEVFVSYGEFDNMETLCNYGFIEDKNCDNIESFRVRVKGRGVQGLVVDQNGSLDNMYNQLSLGDLRVYLATPQEVENLSNYDGVGQLSDRNEMEVFALIVGELEDAMDQAEIGMKEAELVKDDLVASYFRGRHRTLSKGVDWLQSKYPDLF